jgi:hypothetical protein
MPEGVVALLTVGAFFGVLSTDGFGAGVVDPLGAAGRGKAATTGGASGLAVAMGADGGGGPG